MNVWNFTGNLGKDAESRYAPSGDAVVQFSVYEPRFVWAIFQYDDSADLETWNFHSAHWSRNRARYFAKALDGKTRVRKITYEVVPNAGVTGAELARRPR